MEVNIFQVDAFSTKPFGGNSAGVIPNAKWISEADMQRIANEMNVSETAFVHQLDYETFKVRFFTPTREVDLCGHATIATFYTMAHKGYIKSIENGIKTATLQTNIGKFPVDIIYKNGEVENIIMQQDKPKSYGYVDCLDDIILSIGLNQERVGFVDKFIEPEIISTGLPYLLLPIKDKETLDELKFDFCKLIEASKNNHIIGVHAFYLPKRNSDIVYSRNFAPLLGIGEESATGTANGALIYFLKQHNLIEGDRILSLQGESMNRPSKIYCYIKKGDNGYKVKVGGNAVIVIEGILKY